MHGRRLVGSAGVVVALVACSGPRSPVASNTASAIATPGRAGSIAGTVSFPSEGIPPMTIYALPVDATRSEFHVVRTIKNQGAYSIRNVEPGTYHLFAVPTDGFGPAPQHFVGAYTKAVLCGSGNACTDHTPVPVTLSAGQAITGIRITDFYAAENAYPLVPKGGPSLTPLPSPSPSYPDALAAARYEALRGSGVSNVLLGSFGQCPTNDACVALQEKHDGTLSAYFDALAGSNSEVVNCGAYVFQDASGWHPLNMACGGYPAAGKLVSATFMGSGCINVRANPGYSSKIVGCLPVDTMVTIDGGPVFVQETTASDAENVNRLWWHLVGHGWMVHQYLTGIYNTR
jgi:hypothetical protein